MLASVDSPVEVVGYYTLRATALSPEVPAGVSKHIPRYPLVAATLLGRLAVSQTRQGEGLGGLLLADAVRRAFAAASTIGSSMLIADAISERAAAFYEASGFLRLPDSMRVILPMRTIEKMLSTP